MATPEDDISRLIGRLGEDDGSAAAALLPLVYGHLRDLACRYFADQGAQHTLQPTALVHEAYLKLVGTEDAPRAYRGREHFLAVAARAMRQVLVDHARRRSAARRDGGRRGHLDSGISIVAPIEAPDATAERVLDVVRLDESLRRLAALDPRKAEIVTLQYFGGLEQDAIADVVGVSRATVARELTFARAWLSDDMRAHERKDDR
ncbi:MAG: sigma-70 family RNA polymerase sigma factor [Phycisphaerae bacterium]|nr:sigma-70 family RNA polymerase sigma factor [Phycisphaerae bacterium]